MNPPRKDKPRSRLQRTQSDPWQAAKGGRSAEQTPWLISYLDVMTLLFSFFVLLFAYQRAMTTEAYREVQAANAKVEAQAKAVADAKQPKPSEPTTVAAVAVMKSQAEVQQIARAVAAKTPEKPAMQLQPALDVMARIGQAMMPADAVAADQTAEQLAGVLRQDAAGKQVDISRTEREVRMELNEAILFDSGSATLRAEGLALLDRIAPVLNQRPGTISVEGHTDPSPIANAQFPSNWELSAARATAVTRHLLIKGVAAERLRAVGMADTHPRDSNATAEGRARNRRVSMVVYLDAA